METQNETLTVGKLKELLKTLPDEAPVVLTDMNGLPVDFDPCVHDEECGYAEEEMELELIMGIYIHKYTVEGGDTYEAD